MFGLIGGNRLRRSASASTFDSSSGDAGQVAPSIRIATASNAGLQPQCTPTFMPGFKGGHVGAHTNNWNMLGSRPLFMSVASANKFALLTDDLVLTTLTYLTANDLLEASVTSKTVQSYVASDNLWKELCQVKIAAFLRENKIAPVGRYRWKIYDDVKKNAPLGTPEDDSTSSCSSYGQFLTQSATGSRSSSALSSMMKSEHGGRARGGVGEDHREGRRGPRSGNGGMTRSASFADYSTMALGLASAGSGGLSELRTSWDRKQAAECVAALLNELGLPSHRLLYLALPWISLVGVWRHVPTDIRYDFKGELLGITVSCGALVGEVVSPDASRQLRFRVVFSPHEMSPRVLRVTAVKPPPRDGLSTSSNKRATQNVPSLSAFNFLAPRSEHAQSPHDDGTSGEAGEAEGQQFSSCTTMHDLFATGGTEVMLWPERAAKANTKGRGGGDMRAPSFFTLEPLLSQLLPGHPLYGMAEVPSGAGPAHSDYATNSGFLGQASHRASGSSGGPSFLSPGAHFSSSFSAPHATASTTANASDGKDVDSCSLSKCMASSANSANEYLSPGVEPARVYSRLVCQGDAIFSDSQYSNALFNRSQAQHPLSDTGHQLRQRGQCNGAENGAKGVQVADEESMEGVEAEPSDAMEIELRDVPVLVTNDGSVLSSTMLPQSSQPQLPPTPPPPSASTSGLLNPPSFCMAGVPPISAAPLECLRGLWVAPYGSHGLEILHLRTVMGAPSVAPSPAYSSGRLKASFNRDREVRQLLASQELENSNSSPNQKNQQLPIPRLEGLKVVGDANVPASKLSFVVDSSQQFSATERLALDHRLVVAFPPEGAVIADLNLRSDNIAGWYRGMGQINRIQGVWEPDWVGIDFLVYKSGPVGFSVLWDEQGEVIRHIIDFVKLDLSE